MNRILAVFVAALVFVPGIGATPPPTKVLAQKELRRVLKINTKTHQIHHVACVTTSVRRVYVCTYTGVYKGSKVCVKTYVHYIVTPPHRLDHSPDAWFCNAQPPYPVEALPIYPGDEASGA